MSPPRVLLVAGARPNFMKIAPVRSALADAGATTFLIHTGQHYDKSISDVIFHDLGMAPADHNLGVGSGSHAEITAHVMLGFEPVVDSWRPDCVVVVGDVDSTLACALVAAKRGVPVAHVEAGLRSGDWHMPEEINRVLTDRMSTWLFTPSPDADENLAGEGIVDGVYRVGNVMVDSLLAHRERAESSDVRARLGLPGEYAVATMHRPANVDERAVLQATLRCLDAAAARLPVVFPVHPRTQSRFAAHGLDTGVGTLTTAPLGYLDFLHLMAHARLVLTDSGGIQEETTVLGVPCLTLRTNTERPITVELGTNRIVGADPIAVAAGVDEVLAGDVGVPSPIPLWDGRASERIAEVLMRTIA